uniref:Serine/threonine-protein phosphatase 2A regulatory subunit B'' subunit beta n=1 Tax=Pavo cristatus TaxID=9049 RepID=A0A8C9FFG2_PAVCR
MPPGKVLQPVLKMKVDELFLCWLSQPTTQLMLKDCLRRIKNEEKTEIGNRDAGNSENERFTTKNSNSKQSILGDIRLPLMPFTPPQLSTTLPLATSATLRNASNVKGTRRSSGTRVVQTKKEETLPPSLSQTIPTFYFPRGCPKEKVNIDAVIAKIERTFSQFPNERATLDDMGKVAKACDCPLYWKGPLFYCAGGERTGYVSVHKFVAMWRKILQTCYDDAAKFVHLLMNPGCNYLVQEDFIPFLQDVVNSHPGLSFLKEASEFHSRYITTVSVLYLEKMAWVENDHNDHLVSTPLLCAGSPTTRPGSFTDISYTLHYPPDHFHDQQVFISKQSAFAFLLLVCSHFLVRMPASLGTSQRIQTLSPARRYEAELNPVDHQKANVLKYQMEKRPFFEMPSHLADVDLDEYDYEEDFE